jgi:hypothetical protein
MLMRVFTKEAADTTMFDARHVVGWALAIFLSMYLSVPFPVAAPSLIASNSGNDVLTWQINGTAPPQTVSWKYNPQDPSNTTGLVGRWKFDEGLGQIVYDANELKNDGILGNDTISRDNDPLRTNGKFGGALRFDGVDDYVVIPQSASTSQAFSQLSIEFWAKIPTLGGMGMVVARMPGAGSWSSGDWNVWVGSTGGIHVEVADYTPQSIESNIGISDNDWHHVVVALDGTVGKIYIDGVIDKNTSFVGSIASKAYKWTIGKRGDYDTGQILKGILDEVRIYNRTLDDEEVRQNYLQQEDISETVYGHYWAESGRNATYRWDFSINKTWPTNSSGIMITSTFPKGHEMLNVTYPIEGNWSYILPSHSYKVSSYNSTHQNLVIPELYLNQYSDSYRLHTTASNAVSDVRFEVNSPSSSYKYLAPNKNVHVAIKTKSPYGSAINTSTSALLFNEEERLLNKTEGISSNGWFNYSIIMPSRVGKYWFMGNSSGNYAGVMVAQIYVSKIEISLNMNNLRMSVDKVANLSGTAKYTVDNSSVSDGKVTVSGTEYPISSGSFSFTDVKSTVGKLLYKVDSVTDVGGCDAIESNILGYVIWDRIKITEGGVTDNSTNVGQTVKVWFRAIYEHDGEIFDSNKGRLYVGGSDWFVAMDWSPTDNRWEYQYIFHSPDTKTFEVVRVFDGKYGITTINDQAGPQSISGTESVITILGNIILAFGIVTAGTLLILIKKKRAHKRIPADEKLQGTTK